MATPVVGTRRASLVLYASADEPFVRGFLVPAFGVDGEGAPIDARDLATVEVGELERALVPAVVVIAVVSTAFLTDRWARVSELMVSASAIERRLELIVVQLESCELPLHMRSKTRHDCTSPTRWDSVAERLRTYLARPAPVEAELACPYPGMRPFQAEDARYFYGRSAEIATMMTLLASGEREVYLVGPSGSGKSSLVYAGVLPRLTAQPDGGALVVRTMRPGDAPVRRLAECLEAPAEAAPDVGAWLASHAGARLLVFVDQLEELFTLAPAAEQAAFAAALRGLRGEARCTLVLAVRADFYAQLLQSALWLDGHRRHVDLPALRGPALREAITQPAQAIGVYLEAALLERLLGDAAGEPGVLPLLQETLVQLWGHRRRLLLTLSDYAALGSDGQSGLAMAISSRADRCLAAMAAGQVALARRLLVRLVSFGEGRPNTRRRQTRAQLVAGELAAEAEAVLRQLIAARLVIVDGDERGVDQVDLCHEALITGWRSFASWVEARRGDEQRRRDIEASAARWIARGRGRSGLLDDGELAAAVAWRRSDAAHELGETAEVSALVDASGAALLRTRRIRRRWTAGIIASLVVVATVTTGLAVVARSRAREAAAEKAVAVRQAGEMSRELGRQAVVSGRFAEAMGLLVEARAHGVDDAGVHALFKAAAPSAVVLSLAHGGPVTAVAYSADGTKLVTAGSDGTARLWDATSGAELGPPLRHARPIVSVSIAAGGRIVTICDDFTVRIWDAAPPAVSSASPASSATPARSSVSSAESSASSPSSPSSSAASSPASWASAAEAASSSGPSSSSASVAALVPVVLHHNQRVNAAVLSDDGETVVTASGDRTARLWNARSGALLCTMPHGAAVTVAAISHAGSRVATVSAAQSVLWDARGCSKIAALLSEEARERQAEALGEESRARSAWYAREAELRAELDKRAERMTPEEAQRALGALEAKLERELITDRDAKQAAAARDAMGIPAGHTKAVLDAAFSADGARLVTGSADGTALVWDAETGKPLRPALRHGPGVTHVRFSPDGNQITTVAGYGQLWLWDVGSAVSSGRDLKHEDRVVAIAYSSDGTRLLTGDEEGWTRIRDVASTAIVAEIPLELKAVASAVSPDGARVAMARSDGIAHVWEPRTLAPRTISAGEPSAFRPNIEDAVFSADGSRIATIAHGDNLRLWTASGVPVAVLSLLGPIGAPSGPGLLNGERHVSFDRTGQQIMAITPTGKAMIGSPGAANLRYLEDAGPATRAPDEPIGRAFVRGAFSPDGRRFATVYGERGARIWDTESGQPATPPLLHSGPVWTMRFSPDGRRLLTASADSTARLWDAATGAGIEPALAHPPGCGVTAAAFSPDGSRIATVGTDFQVRLWDAASSRVTAVLSGHTGAVASVAFSADGTMLISHSVDGTARIWRTATGALVVPPLVHASEVPSAAFSPEGARVATASGHNVQLWDVVTGRPLGAPLVHAADVIKVEFSPDGGTLLSVASDAVRLWRTGLDMRSLDDWKRVAAAPARP